MGNSQKNHPQPASQDLPPQPPRELTALQRWQSSQKTQEDLIAFLTSSKSLSECANTLYHFIRSINKREKYQNCVMGVLDYLRAEQTVAKFREKERREVFTHLTRKLRASFFVVDFSEVHLEQQLSPSERLFFLYQYYSLQQERLQTAIFFNYPSILLGLAQFMRRVMEEEVVVNQECLLRMILPPSKLEQLSNYCELTLPHLTDDEREILNKEMAAVQDPKQLYLLAVEEALRFDHADLASCCLRSLLGKGHHFSHHQLELLLKVEIYSVLLYELGRLSLDFSTLRGQSIADILHFFFTSHQLEDTPLLVRCFDIFPEQGNIKSKWQEYAFSYLFSQNAHVSTLLRLLSHKYLHFLGTSPQFYQLISKIRASKCQIGKYVDQLASLALLFPVAAEEKLRYRRLLKLVEVYYLFNINAEVESLYQIVYAEWEEVGEERSGAWERGLEMLRNVIVNYFTQFQVKLRSVEWEGQEFSFSSVFEMLRFVHFLKKTFLNNFISTTTTHQIFFKQLIKHQRYPQIKALLAEQRQAEFGIDSETVGMIVSDHLVTLLTTTKLKKNDETVRLLFNILGINPTPNCWHYLAAHYNYLKYLQQRDITLPLPMKQALTIDNLYFIANNHSNRLQQLDFNLLFSLQSCHKVQYTNTNAIFIPIITDQFLKFKVFLCSKAFAMKKNRFGTEVMDQVVRYEPPWIGTELVKILRENGGVVEDNFIAIAFNYCARGEDLEYMLSLANKGKSASASKLSLLKLKNWSSMLQQDQYLLLTDELILNQQLYKNLVAELTFNEGESIKSNHFLFFHLLTIDPPRGFNYALNYAMPPVFIVNFVIEGVKRGVIHMHNAIECLLKFLFFSAKKQGYVSLKKYNGISGEEVCRRLAEGSKGTPYVVSSLDRMAKNYQILQAVTTEFLDLYVPSKDHFKFLYEQSFRKEALVSLREQPMSKLNSKVLRALGEKAGIDMVDLSLFNLISKVNSNQQLDNECWTIAQKLIHWGDDQRTGRIIVQRLTKIQTMELFLSVVEFLRESQPVYREIVTEYHLQLIRSLAAVEVDKNLFGIFPEDFFQTTVAVRTSQQKGMLSDTHRRILRESACVQNIFVVSKALYFMYGCSEEVEKVVLGEFSLRQEDSEEFEELRKKIRRQGVK